MRRRLVTPEGVDLGVTLGDVGQRISAFIVDAMLLIVALIALTLFAIFGIGSIVGRGEQQVEWVAIIWLLGFFFLRNAYFIVMELRPRAATFGKRIVGLRVVARDGGRLTADAVIARNLMREIEVFVPLSLLATGAASGLAGWLGFAWAAIFLFFPLTNRDRLRVGDLLAGTWVIRTQRSKLAADLASTSHAAVFDFTLEQLDAYGIYELETLEGVIRRGNAKAKRVVAQAIVDRIGWHHDVGAVDAFLTAYYTQLRARLEGGLLMGKRRADKHAVV